MQVNKNNMKLNKSAGAGAGSPSPLRFSPPSPPLFITVQIAWGDRLSFVSHYSGQVL